MAVAGLPLPIDSTSEVPSMEWLQKKFSRLTRREMDVVEALLKPGHSNLRTRAISIQMTPVRYKQILAELYRFFQIDAEEFCSSVRLAYYAAIWKGLLP